ncbi:MAG TPA: glycosyltransferase [Candidatus Acidoferrales bacterium]|nr:glycosyltransferase [Candidatus Acidoferrales bacterium]
MQKIEFCFFDAGGGHRAAATALDAVVRAQNRPWDVQLTNLQELLDQLDILKKYAGIRIQDFYNWMLRSGWTLGSEQLMRVLQIVIRLYHRPTVRMLEAHWRETQPDMVVSFVPHFNRALCESFGRAFPGRPFVTVLTDIADFPPHFWIEWQPQYLVCGSDRAVAQAKSLGHPDERIFRASGMILNPKFYEPPVHDRLAERERLGLRRDVPTGIVLFGGHGSKVMLEIAERLARSSLELQLIFICGKNEKLAAALLNGMPRLPRFVEGFTKKVNYYMQLADFFIGKPGPGSISEALAMRLPVIVECNARTLPQERYNCKWVLEKEVGVVLKSFKNIEGAVAKMIEPATLARYRANAEALHNRAVFQIPDMLEKILEQHLAGVSRSRSDSSLRPPQRAGSG